METIVVSDTVQIFNGERFYLCGFYFQHNGKRLHRAVWEYHNGKIPKGYHVHHIDSDRTNNDISNLSLLSMSEHLSNHMNDEERKNAARLRAEKIRPLTKEWHHSEEGRAWHREHGKKCWEDKGMRDYQCDYCGKEYQSRKIMHNTNHFCSGRCKAAFRRRRLRECKVS